MANVQAIEANFVGAYKNMGSKANVYRLTPFISTTPADLIYLVGHEDMVAFGKQTTEFVGTSQGAMANFALAQVMDCDGGLYSGNTIHSPPAP